MEITENITTFGTTFMVKYNVNNIDSEFPSISFWLCQNNIQFIYDHPRVLEHHYYIKDEAGIMAFKLRWL